MIQTEALTGNQAIAHGVRLSRVKLIAAYPITPQTTIAETLASFIADGLLEAECIEGEGEHPMMSAVNGAALTGTRTFFATCSQGFLFGLENIAWSTGARLPIVMAVTNRGYQLSGSIWCDHSDAMTARDMGWIQLYVESNQEALDTVIQAYRIAEDQRVLLPVMVCIDGFILTHNTEMVEIPDQESIDTFLPQYESKHIILDPDNPMEIVAGGIGQEQLFAYEYRLNEIEENAKVVIQEANEEFTKRFGRGYGNGLTEKVNCDDAEVVLVTLGSMSGTAKQAIRELRKEGKHVGLVKLRSFRPFPKEDFWELAKSTRVIAVVDRNISKGRGEGAVFTEVKSTLYNLETRPRLIGFIAGLQGNDILVSDMKYIANKALEVSKTGEVAREVEWIPNVEVTVKELVPVKREKLYYPGTTACPGCGMGIMFRHLMESLGRDIILIRSTGCGAWVSSERGKTGVGVPFGRSVLPSGCSLSAGVSRGMKLKGREEVKVVLVGGDGSVGDMGFLALSGAAERNEDFMCVVYDNEAYANTGVQRSGTTPIFAWTTTTPVGINKRGKATPKKDLPIIVAAHRVPYVATASVAYIEDLKMKLKKAKSIKGFRYIHVYVPCPISWRIPSEKTIEISRLGVETGVHPLYEIEDGKLKITHKPEELMPVERWLKPQGRFAHLTDMEVNEIQEDVDQRWTKLLRWQECGLPL